MKKIRDFIIGSRFVGLITFFTGIIATTVMHGFSLSFVFIDKLVFIGFMLMIQLIFGFIALYGLSNYIISVFDVKINGKSIKESRYFKVANIICMVFAFVNIIMAISFIALMANSALGMWTQIKNDIIYPFIVLVFGVTLVAITEIKKTLPKIITLSIIALGIVIYIVNAVFPFARFEFTSKPAVFDNGQGYSVVFATTDTSVGYLEYEIDGKTVRIYDSENGKKIDDRIHSIPVSYEDLNARTYKIGAVRTYVQHGYGGRTGKEIISDSYKFNAPIGSDIKALSISDWHTYIDRLYDAVEYAGDYDVVLCLGDVSAGVTCQEEIIDCLINVVGNVSGGEMPIIYSRGNHDTRGKEACNLTTYLGLDSLYYTLDVGDYTFITLDSGEDKEDSHVEYGGYNNFEKYISDEILWLEQQNTPEKTLIALSHQKGITSDNSHKESAYAKLKELGCELIISGHSHSVCKGETSNAIPTFEDGGYTDEDTFWCSVIHFTDGKIEITSFDNSGNVNTQEPIIY